MPRFALLCILAIATPACGGVVGAASEADAGAEATKTDASTEDATTGPSLSPPDAPPAPRDATDPYPVDAGQVVVASVAPCLVGGSVIYLDGDPGDPVHPGAATFRFPSGQDLSSCGAYLQDGLLSTSCPSASGYGATAVSMAFGSTNGAPLTPGVYENAISSSANKGTQPFIRVQASGDAGGACWDYAIGSFQIEQLELDVKGQPTQLLISFEQQCALAAGATLRGCIRIVP